MSRFRAALLCLLTACEGASFESLGTLSSSSTASAPADRDAVAPAAGSSPQLQLVAAPGVAAGTAGATASAAGASGGAAAASMGAIGTSAAAGSRGSAGTPAALSGKIGDSFAVRSGYVSGLSDELEQTTLYLFDSVVSCAAISTLAWLSQLPSTVQVIEVAFPARAPIGSPVLGSSVSYARGGTYSFTKTRASTSSLLLSDVSRAGTVDGTLTASFASGGVSGTFHAEFCASGTAF